MKQQTGVLSSWDDARGCGWIVDHKGREIFVHIRAFERSRSRPQAGEKVRFRVEPDAARGVRAVDVERCWRPGHLLLPAVLVPLMVVCAYFAALGWCLAGNVFVFVLLPALGLLSTVTFLLFAWDKRAARLERQRVAEKTLLLFSLAGGWPGALLARPLFRHKTRKQPFRTVFWLAVVVNLGLLGGLLFSPQAAALRDWLDVVTLGGLITLKEWGWIRGTL